MSARVVSDKWHTEIPGTKILYVGVKSDIVSSHCPDSVDVWNTQRHYNHKGQIAKAADALAISWQRVLNYPLWALKECPLGAPQPEESTPIHRPWAQSR